MAGPIREVDPRTLEVLRTFAAPRLSSHVRLVVGHASGTDNVLVAAGDEALLAIDLASGRRRWVADLRGELFPEPCPFFAVAEVVRRVYCGNHFGQVEERDLATGQQTGVRLDPQLGSVGDLVGAGADGVRSSWGSPPVRRRTPAGGSTARTWSRGCASKVPWHPSATTPPVPTSWWRASSAHQPEGGTARTASWRSPPASCWSRSPRRTGSRGSTTGRLAYWGPGGGGLLDVESEHIVDVPALGPETENVYADPLGANAWVTTVDGGRTAVRRARPAGRDRPRAVRRGRPERVRRRPAPRSGRVLVTYESEDGVLTTAFDRETGAPVDLGDAGRGRHGV